MAPTQVKSKFIRKGTNLEEQITTGLIGSMTYKIIKQTNYGLSSPLGIVYQVYILNEHHEWILTSNQRTAEVLVLFGFIREK